MPFDAIRIGASAAGAYEIERSVRFNEPDSTEFTRTPSSAGNRRTWTFSCWIKKADVGNTAPIFLGGTDTNNYTKITIGSDDKLYVMYNSSGTYNENFRSTQYFKDISGWMHIVVAWDTTQGTASNRIKVYVNGTDIPGTRTNDPPEDFDGHINNTEHHAIGRATYNAGEWFNGYIAEIHHVDGTRLDATSFGKEDALTGQWIPKKYGGSYGTNGFHLNFSDNSNNTAATLGKDSSGNGHNFTPANFSVSAGFDNDSVVDTPTNNYCTLSSTDGGGVSLSIKVNGNLQTATTNGSGHHPCYSTMAVESGKWYVEYESVGGDSWTNFIAPIAHDGASHDQDSAVHNTASPQLHKGSSMDCNYGSVYSGPADTWRSGGSYGSNLGTVGMLAFDLDNNKIYWGSDGTWYDSGDPAAGSNPAFSSIVVNEPFTFGVSTSNGLNAKVNFGAQGFQHTPPTGFKALCTQNLPEPTIKKPSDYFNTVLYTGNDSDGHAITGVGFQPDLVWIKDRGDGNKHRLYDDLRGVNAALHTDDDPAEDQYATYGQFESFDSDGFTVGIGTGDASQRGEGTNSAEPHVAWCWKESATAGFDMVAYTGTGANADISHNLGVAPEAMFIKDRDTADDWRVWWNGVTDTNDKYMTIQGTNALISGGSDKWNGAPTSSVFKVTSDGSLNRSNDDYIAYLFASVSGHSKVGVYYGDGQQLGPFIYTGFKPAWVLVKNTEEASVWNLHDNKRDPYNIVNKVLYPSEPDDEEAYSVTAAASTNKLFLANGFQIFSTHDPEMNASDEKYIYLAFAERPFKYANAR